jgi:hypothetical protein
MQSILHDKVVENTAFMRKREEMRLAILIAKIKNHKKPPATFYNEKKKAYGMHHSS